MAAWVGPALLAASTVGSSLLNNKKKSAKQVPMMPPQQSAALDELLKIGRSGVFNTGANSIRFGEDIGLPQGNYNLSGMETDAIGRISSLLDAGESQGFTRGREALMGFLGDNDGFRESQFAPFEARADREIMEARDAAKRGASFAGNLYSTDTIRNLGDIEAKGAESKMQFLANLENEALNRRLQAIPQLLNLELAQDELENQRISNALNVGGFERTLDNARINEERQELLRRRGESMMPMNALQTVAGTGAPFGVPEVETYTESPYQDLLNMIAMFGGNLTASKMGGGGGGGSNRVPAPSTVGPYYGTGTIPVR